MTLLNVFGTKEKDAINLFDPPYAIRNNCQIGQWTIGEDQPIGKELEIAILKVVKMHGDLGKTKDTNWLQVWFIASPSEKKIPENLVCVTYIKTRSIMQLGMEIMNNMTEDVDPGIGIFKTSFLKHEGEKGKYYSLDFKWRTRTKTEEPQLKLIEKFLATNPVFIDSGIPNTLKIVDINALTSSLEEAPAEQQQKQLINT